MEAAREKAREFSGRGMGAIILAGGDSKRLGRPKAFLELDGVTLIERAVALLQTIFNSLTVVTDRRELFSHLPVYLTADLLAGSEKTPLRGIHAGLSLLPLPHQFVVACDMPFLNTNLIQYMAGLAPGYDVVVPRIGPHYQPLHAFYSRRCREVIAEQLSRGDCKVARFYPRVRVLEVGEAEITRYDPLQKSFFNINAWDDYHEAHRILNTRS